MKFDSRDTFFKKPFGAIRKGEKVTLSVQVTDNSWFNKIMTVFCFDKNGIVLKLPMKSYESEEKLTCEFSDAEYSGLVWYYFEVENKDGSTSYFGRNTNPETLDNYIPSKYQLTIYDGQIASPSWYAKGVTYQVFVDRFNRGKNSPVLASNEDYFVHTNLNDKPHYKKNRYGDGYNSDIYGGDLQGIIEKLDYLSKLGVTTIYLSPIFEAWSNHKYNTANYKEIDPNFGDESDLSELCEAAGRLGMRVILDGVFSHTGSDSIYFNANDRYLDIGAVDPRSKYRKWYSFDSDGKYSSWWGIKSLPVINKNEKSFIDFIITGSDSVIEHWMKLGISGWRLDVADELPSEFLKTLYDKVKSINKEAIVIGEVWEDASYKISYGERRHYFTNPELDGVMNYPLRDAIIRLLRREISAYEFSEGLNSILENYPEHALSSLMNIISSHDTMRIITALKAGQLDGESKDFKSKFTLSSDEYEQGVALLKVAVTLQYMFPGSPTIYYGDEIGMEGFGDPFCREYFKWDKVSPLTDFYQKMGELKRSNPALYCGEMKINVIDDNFLYISRSCETSCVFVFVNLSDYRKMIVHEFDSVYSDFLDDSVDFTPGLNVIPLAPMSSTILVKNE